MGACQPDSLIPLSDGYKSIVPTMRETKRVKQSRSIHLLGMNKSPSNCSRGKVCSVICVTESSSTMTIYYIQENICYLEYVCVGESLTEV